MNEKQNIRGGQKMNEYSDQNKNQHGMNTKISSIWTSTYLPNVMVLAVFACFCIFYFYRSVTTQAPIIATDEYVYYILSRYHNQVDIFAIEPWLQHINNQLFFALHSIWINIDGGNGIPVIRAVHFVEWVASAALLYAAFSKVAKKRSRVLGVCAMIWLPSSFYSLLVMPEADLVFLAALLGYVVIRWLCEAPLRAAAAAGVICGVALLIKPHAIAWVPAMFATIFCVAYLRRSERGNLLAAAVFIFGWYIGVFFAWRLSTGSWSFNPSLALGLQFYGGLVSKAGSVGFLEQNFTQILKHFFWHLVALVLMFGPALIGILLTCYGVKANKQGDNIRLLIAGVFVLSMLFSLLVMTSYFTASAAENSIKNAGKMHGRYLGVILVFLPFFFFMFLENLHIRTARLSAFAGLGATIIFYGYIINNSGITPHDYPLLSILKRPEFFAFYVIGFIVSAVKVTWFRAIMTIQLVTLLCVANLHIQNFLFYIGKAHGSATAMAEILGQTLQPAMPGDGVFIGVNDFTKYYPLFGLGNAPKFLGKEPGATISALEVQGAKWVILSNSYNVEFPYRSSIKLDNLTLYPLETTRPLIVENP